MGGFRWTATTVSTNTGLSMDLLTQLPHRFRRRYLPESLDYERWTRLEPFYRVLEERELDSVERLEQWLLDWSELSDAVGEEGSLRYIRMTCDTENPEIEKAYFHFLEEIAENLKAADDRLKRCFLNSPARGELPPRRYSVLDRSLQNDVDLFRQANIALETRESKGTQRYQKLIGSLTVSFEGKEQTLQQMKRYLEYPERSRREAAWKVVVERRLKERDHLEGLFEELLGIRAAIAANAGFDSYRDYMFRRLERFDYGPEDCYRFHQGVESVVVPLARKLQRLRAAEMGLESLRPWDLSVDPLGRPPLRPFTRTAELVGGCVDIARRVDSRFAGFLETMRSHGLLNLDSRKGKAPGGYQSTLDEARLPFIFMNSVGVDGDVRTLLHEAGHALHVFATQEEALGHYRHGPIEFCEVASMSHGTTGRRASGSVLQPGRRPETLTQKPSGGYCGHSCLDRPGGRVPALDIHPPRTQPGSTERSMGGVEWTLRRNRGLVGIRRSPPLRLAPPTSYFRAALLLHRIRHRSTGSPAGLAELQERLRGCRQRLLVGAPVGRKPPAAGTLPPSGSRLRLRTRHPETPDGESGSGIGGPLTTSDPWRIPPESSPTPWSPFLDPSFLSLVSFVDPLPNPWRIPLKPSPTP